MMRRFVTAVLCLLFVSASWACETPPPVPPDEPQAEPRVEPEAEPEGEPGEADEAGDQDE